MDATTNIDWFALPSPVWYRILGSLAVSDVAAFSSSSSSAYTLTLDDLGVWKQRCIDAGFTQMLNAPVPSYHALFRKFLYRYGSLIGALHTVNSRLATHHPLITGKWRTDINGIGAILLITLDGPRVVANSVHATDAAADYTLQPFFEVVFADDGTVKIHCKHFGDCNGCGHPAQLEWDEGSSDDRSPSPSAQSAKGRFRYSCHQGCRHDLQELHARLVAAPGRVDATIACSSTTFRIPPEFLPCTLYILPIQHPTHYTDTDGSAARRRSAHLLQSTRLLAPLAPGGEQVTFCRFSPPSSDPHPLAGLWRGGYGDAGVELVTLRPTPLLGGGSVGGFKLTAEKATGDVRVPAGHVSFWFTVSADASAALRNPAASQPLPLVLPGPHGGLEVDAQASLGGGVPRWVVARGPGKGVVALPGYERPEWLDIEVLVFSASSIGVLWPSLRFLQLFSRLVLG